MNVDFAKNTGDIINSVINFSSNESNIIRAALGSHAKYFVCLDSDSGLQFGLSKFCVFSDMSLPEYIGSGRHQTGGGKAQKHISKILNSKWIPLYDCNEKLKSQFEYWITNVFPAYNLDQANIILIKESGNISKRKRKVSQDELDKILNLKKDIGELGELIAFEYEVNRLKELGCLEPEQYIAHISKTDANAGYDIVTSYKQARLIEVKATVSSEDEFYITANELKVLEMNKDKSYLYIVKITDIRGKVGKVIRVIQDPISKIIDKEPILFKAKI